MSPPRRTISFFLALAASVATTFLLGILFGGTFYFLEAKAGRIKSFGKLMDPWDAAGESALWAGSASLIGGILLGVGAGSCLKVLSVLKGEEFAKLRSFWIGFFGVAFGIATGILFSFFGPMALIMFVSGLVMPLTVRLGEVALQKLDR